MMRDRTEVNRPFEELTFSRHSHHQTLENIAASALADGDFATAFKFADRRCRIEPPPLAHCFVLRADAAYKLGDHAGAMADLDAALQIAPDDLAALRRQLAWGSDAERNQAASTLILHDQNVGVIRTCAQILVRAGRRRLAVASVYDFLVSGWVVWDSDQDAELCIAGNDTTLTYALSPDPFHPLSRDMVRAASFRLPRARCATPQQLSISVEGERIYQHRLPSNAPIQRSARKPPLADHGDVADDYEPPVLPTVIVPVYADYSATRACIGGLIADNPSGASYRILIVNDATPDPAIARYLSSLGSHKHVEIQTNPINLGFVASVNMALSQVPLGDVVLLNADTLVPPGFVARLAHAAHSSSDIGTVVPLSNNSEISDFPLPYRNNPLRTHLDVIQLNRIVSRCNPEKVVDLPNGTGFCLYVTRACLDAVGQLSESFHRGYFEDIDFCLRARERGFRNVCAASVYVGHAGSRSFKSEKRTLVRRNLDVLDRRFPQLRAETAAFIAADPLRPSRQAIERHLPMRHKQPVLLFTGGSALLHVARSRAAQLAKDGQPVIFLDLVAYDRERKIRLRSEDDDSPQSLAFSFSNEVSLRDFRKYLRLLFPSHCEIIDAALFPSALAQTFTALKLPFDLWIADDALGDAQVPVRGLAGLMPDNRPLETDPYEKASAHGLIAGARRILAASPMAREFATNLLQGRKMDVIQPSLPPEAEFQLADFRQDDAPTLVVVPTRSSAREFAIIRHIADLLNDSAFDISILIAGATISDQRLLSFENVFVTGDIESTELTRVLQPHNVQWMLTGFDKPLFGHPLIETVRNCQRPVAYVDWSAGAIGPRAGDLPIRPGLSVEQVAIDVCFWIEGS